METDNSNVLREERFGWPGSDVHVHPFGFEKQKILIVDDKKENLFALRKVLEGLDVDIIGVGSGNEALAATLNHHFAVAILDVMMPGMDGYELAEHLRGDAKTRRMPIIFLTAFSSDEEQVFKGYEAGGVDFIVKPYNPDVLMSKVSIFLELERTRSDLAAKVIALTASEERYRSLVMTVPDIVYRIDPDGRFSYLNHAVNALGYAPENLLGSHFSKILIPTDVEKISRESILPQYGGKNTGPADSPKLFDERRTGNRITRGLEVHLLPLNVESTGQTKIYNDEPDTIIAEINSSGIYTDGFDTKKKIFLGSVGVIRDITQRKQVEEELAKHRDKLQDLVKVKVKEHENLQAQLAQAQKMESIGRLAGGVAHDYNNALSVIIGFTELSLDDMDLTEKLRGKLDEILKAAIRATDITRQLLAFARKQAILPNVLDLNKNIDGMLKMLIRLIGEDIDLVWLPGELLWPVKMDPSQIDQILANLCVNARDAIVGVGKVIIETENVTIDEAFCADHVGFNPGEFVLLSVSDDGCGMEKEIANNIFEPFFTTKDMDKGTGLGLSTVYGIVRQNNGFVDVYSEPGKGTVIRIYLSRYEGEDVAIREEITEEIPVGRGETVLLVEDDLSILKLARTMLNVLGYTVLTAGTPDEAITLARENAGKIHLLITDVIMPEMNGRELADRLQAFYPNLKRMFMSGYTANVIARHGVLEEGVRFVQKPFSKRGLATTARRALDE